MALGHSNTRTILEKSVMEFFLMLLFVYFGVGTAMSNVQGLCANNGQVGNVCTNEDLSNHIYGSTINPRVFQVALAFGMTIMVLVFSGWSLSGGHVNCMVTTALMVSGHCPIGEGLSILVCQFLGAFAGAGLLAATVPEGMDGSSGNFGTNWVQDGFSQGNAFCGEFVMSFLLLFVIYHTAVYRNDLSDSPWDNKVKNFAPVAIGMSVFCAHCVLIPITGCSINPTRSLGPLLVGEMRGLPSSNNGWSDLWIFFVAPELAAVVAGLAFPVVWKLDDRTCGEQGDEAQQGTTDSGTTTTANPVVCNTTPSKPNQEVLPMSTMEAQHVVKA